METSEYHLTDGITVYDTRWMTPDEAVDANRRAKEATDGNLYWVRSRR